MYVIQSQVTLSEENILGFLELLLSCGLLSRVISNYCSAIKSYLSIYQIPVEWLNNTLLSNYLRALHIQVLKSTLSMLVLKDWDFQHSLSLTMASEVRDLPLPSTITSALSPSKTRELGVVTRCGLIYLLHQKE